MAFSSATPEPFRTETAGDFILAEVVSAEEMDSKPGMYFLLVKTYDKDVQEPQKDKNGQPLMKDGKPVMGPKAKLFNFFDLNAARDYRKRQQRASNGAKGELAAHKYLYATCTGVNDSGYAKWDVQWSNDRNDMSALVKEKGGTYFDLHLAEPKEKPKTDAKNGGNKSNNNKGGDESDDADIPF